MHQIRTAIVFTLTLLAAGIAGAQDMANHARGFEADKTYQFGSLDAISVYNGNLMLTVPLGQQFPVSPQLQYGFTLMYNSKVWDSQRVEVAPGVWRSQTTANLDNNAGFGWRLSFGRLMGTPDVKWRYESADGGEHALHKTAHPGDPEVSNVWYTRDGTYMRVRRISSSRMELDFPTGVTHVFEPDGNDKWRIQQIHDRFLKTDGSLANFVDFDYASTSTTGNCAEDTDRVWKIEDSHGRQHEVCLANASFDGKNVMTVQRVNLAAFTSAPARYELFHIPQTVTRGCWGTFENPEDREQNLPLLHSLTLPDQSLFTFGYNLTGTADPLTGQNCEQGTLKAMNLPTGGSQHYLFKSVQIPAGTACGDHQAWSAMSTGVKTKIQKDASGAEIARWEYNRFLSANPPDGFNCMNGEDPAGGTGIPANEEMQVHITSPSKDKTVHYFSVWPGQDNNEIVSPNGFDPMEHGLPFTRFQPTVSGRFLSTEVYDCDDNGVCPGTPIRRTYVLYEKDAQGYKHEANRRVKGERTVFVDDGNRYRDVDNDDFDGWGHYRETTISSNFGPTRVSRTNYNPGSDVNGRAAGLPFFDKDDPWLLSLSNESWIEENGVKARTLTCHDPETGFLEGRRTLENATVANGAHDVVVLFKADVKGNVEQEDWFGGDTQDVSAIADLCAPREGSRYRISHTYDNGGLTSTSFHSQTGTRGVFHTPVRQTINHNTGLVRTSTDAADVVTTYSYDAMGRVREVTSPGSATVKYDYRNFNTTGFPFAAVLIDVDSADPENDNQQRIDFDSFGRVVKESRELPDGKTALRATEYDSSGRKKRVSVWEAVPSHFTTFTYDALGRTKSVKSPDGKVSAMKYEGDRTSTKSAQLGTGFDAVTGTVTLSHVAATEVRDVHGRLIEVQEGRAATVTNDAIVALGTPEVTTAYTYDIGGRLATVRMTGKDMDGVTRTQPRDFEYDLRGFLTKETHPESGTTEYRELDAKGHARYIDQGPQRDIFDLEFVYDDAERQTGIKSRTALNAATYRPQKEFVFDSSNSKGRSRGKLITAKRHNYTSIGDILVTESFTYDDVVGRLTEKKTKIENLTAGTTYQEVEQKAEYNDLGLQKLITYPACLHTACGSPAWPSISQTFAKGYLRSVGGFIENITYHENGLYDTITHDGTVKVRDVQVPDDDGLPRPKSISVEGGIACPTPVITTQPASKTIPTNTSTQLSVVAEGALHYQWYEGQAGVKTSPLGLDQATLDTPVITSTRFFWVEVTNSCGFVRSIAARVDVISCGNSTFSITASPQNVLESQTFTLTAPAIPNTTYRWFRGPHGAGVLLEASTNSSYTVNGGVGTATQFYVEMQDPVCNVTAVKSQVLTVTPCAKPLAREIHSSTTGPLVTLSVDDLGDGATFQWYQGSSYSDLSKPLGTGPSITVTPTAATPYWVRMTRTCGTLTTTADTPILTVNVACATSIFVQPKPVTKPMPTPGDGGISLSTTVVAGGTGPFTYQWYEVDIGGPEPIDGATEATFTWNYGLQPGDHVPLAAQRIVFVKVRACGVDVDSNRVMLSVVKTPQRITGFSEGQALFGSYNAQLFVTMDPPPSGEHVYEYEWFEDDGSPAGRRLSNTDEDVNVGPGIYWVKVSGQHNTPPDEQGNVFTYYEESVSPFAYVWDYGTCELPPLRISQSVSSIVSGNQGVTFLAFCNWHDVTYQWYEGQSGDTREPVTVNPATPNQLTASSTVVQSFWVRASIECGAYVDSPTLVFTKNGCAPVLINQDIEDVDVAYNGTATLKVDPISVARPSYTWYKGEGEINSVGHGASFSIPNVIESGRYWVKVRNLDCGNSSRSYLATVRVASCPSITPPNWQTEFWTDSNTTKTLSALSGGANGYQWYQGEVGDTTNMIGGATLATYTTPALTADAKYWVRVFGSGCIVDSPTMTVKVCDPPHAAGTIHLNHNSSVAGQWQLLGINAAGTNRSYQWYLGLTGDTSRPIGRPIDRLHTNPSQTTDYWVRVTGRCGPAGTDVRHYNSPTYTISVCPGAPAPSAALTKVMPGTTTTITIAATGTRLTYQWYIGTSSGNGTPIPGATAPTLTTPAITAATSFWCAVTSGNCTRNSPTVTVSLCDKPTVRWTTGDRSIKKGELVSLAVDADGTETETPLITFYTGNTGDVAGSTVIRAASTDDDFAKTVTETTKFWARAAIGNCYADTPNITVTVCIPQITTQPAGGEITLGQSKTLTVASDITPTGYQWYIGETGDVSRPVTGGTAASLIVTPTVDTKYWVRVRGCGSFAADSTAVLVTVCVPPAITLQPAPSQWIIQGQSKQLHVNASGTTVTYTWYRGTPGDTSTPIGTNGSITVSPAATTTYWARASNACGSANSNAAVINVCAIPQITAQPLSQPIFSGKTATLSVTATQATATPVTYQWYTGSSTGTNGTAISGATSPTYTTPALTSTAHYWVRISAGTCTVDSAVASITICAYPEVINAPDDRDIPVGGTTRLHLITSPVPESVQWYRGAQGDRSHPISLSQPDVSPTVTTQYWADVTYGGCTAKTRTVTVFVSIPTITTQPAPTTQVNNGQTATLTVVANTSPLTYQWYSGTSGSGTPIAGATNASYTTPALIAAASYWVKVTGSRGHAVNSDTANVTVCAPAVITSQPPNRSIQKGSSTSLSVSATGTNLRYQWYNGTAPGTASPISGATSSSVTVSPTVPKSYWVRVTSDCGTADSTTATVTVCATPVISQQPLSQTIFSGRSVTLSIAATQETGIPMTYQWYSGTSGSGTAIAGATGTSYTTPTLTAGASYWVKITSGICSVNSDTAAISICAYSEVINSPDDRDITLGGSTTLHLIISPVPDAVQWYRGAQGVKTNPISLSQPSVSPTVTTQYWAEVTYNGCTAKTRTVTVFVSIPTITTQPAPTTQVNSGQSATLSVVANTSPLTYQWYSGTSGSGTPISGATSASYTTPALTAAASYWVKVTGSRGHTVNSNTATVTVCAPAVITSHPQNRSIQKGNNATLTVSATGTDLTYQWYAGASGNTASPIGSTTTFVTVSPTVPKQYWVRVTSDCGVADSNTATVDVCATPVISQQPLSQPVFSGRSVTLSVAATQETGMAMSYQWYSGTSGSGTPIAGATGTSYTTPALTSGADYWVKITSGICSANSDTASITICSYNEVINAPDDRDIAVGGSTQLRLIISPVPDAVQWYRGAQGVKTNPISLSQPTVSPTVTTQYWAEVTYNGCTAKTRTVTVFVSIPTITTQPAPTTQVNGGTSATLSVVANTSPLTYQWFSGTSGGGTPISGATGASYVTPALGVGSTASYWVKVTGSRGHVVNSDTAVVNWCNPATITKQPANRSIVRGSSTILTTMATGTNIRYQWYNGASGVETSPITNATDTFITVSPTVPKQYWVKAISDCGSQNSVTANVDVCVDPTINVQPLSKTIYRNTSTTLSVTATAGTALPLSYQWYAGTSGSGTAIAGATSSTYTTPVLSAGADYWVLVTSGVCSVESATASIDMCAYNPTLNTPDDKYVAYRDQTLMRVIISPVPQSAKWYQGVQGDRTTLLSSSTQFYLYPTATMQVWGELTHDGCTTMTRTVTVNVCVPSITTQPESVTIPYNTSTTLSVTARTASTYQWYTGPEPGTGTPIPGATSATYTTPKLIDPASYWVRINGSCNRTIDSELATVTVP